MLGWNQIDLAREAGVSRGSVQRIEDGIALSEGKESRIETALGWRLGSLDFIRDGGEPMLAARPSGKPLGEWTRHEATDRAEEIAQETGDDKQAMAFMLRWLEAVKAATTNDHVGHDAR